MSDTLELEVEGIGGVCNATCSFCPLTTRTYFRDHGMPVGTMAMALYRKIIEEAATIPQITSVKISGLSESLLDRHLVERISLTRALIPAALISTYTNGSYLTPEKLDALRDAGMSEVSISLNAVTAEKRLSIMGLDDFEKVCGYIDYAIKNAGQMRVFVKAVLNKDVFSEEDALRFYQRWGHQSFGGHGQVVQEGNWAGENRTVVPFDPNSCCFRATGQMYVTWEGRVTPCCAVPNADTMTFGDLRTQTIREVYGSAEYIAFRQAHSEDRAAVYAVCKICTRA